ncbi:MAG: hypothetical protein AABW73_01980 [Nanoarchaeota archaeon]
MKAFINAVGSNDSLGNDRLGEIRGLVKFADRPVIAHQLDRFLELGVTTPVLVYTNPEHKSAYEEAKKSFSLPIDVKEYSGSQAPLLVYCAALKEFGTGNHALVAADDNLYDFSLVPMMRRFYDLNRSEGSANLLPVRDIGKICDADEGGSMNFGMCRFDNLGKVTGAS